MPGISRLAVDTAGGAFIGNLAPTVVVNGQPVIVKGAAIASHGQAPHSNAHTAGASGTVFAGGIAVCRAGDVATCGHAGTGSPNVSAG
jgi:uncharacterized Zn-binding protein involved in type VI secretion